MVELKLDDKYTTIQFRYSDSTTYFLKFDFQTEPGTFCHPQGYGKIVLFGLIINLFEIILQQAGQ